MRWEPRGRACNSCWARVSGQFKNRHDAKSTPTVAPDAGPQSPKTGPPGKWGCAPEGGPQGPAHPVPPLGITLGASQHSARAQPALGLPPGRAECCPFSSGGAGRGFGWWRQLGPTTQCVREFGGPRPMTNGPLAPEFPQSLGLRGRPSLAPHMRPASPELNGQHSALPGGSKSAGCAGAECCVASRARS